MTKKKHSHFLSNRWQFTLLKYPILLLITVISISAFTIVKPTLVGPGDEPTPCNPEIITFNFNGCETFGLGNVASNECSSGGNGWLNSANVLNDNTATSLVLMTAAKPISECLDVTTIEGTIPSEAIINGIEVNIRGRANFLNAVNDSTVVLLKGGVPVGNNYATGMTWTNSVTTFTYGGTTDLWGTTWTPAEINAADFGLRFQAGYVGSNNRQAQIQYIEINVCYTVVTGVPGEVCTIVTSTDIGGTVWHDRNFDALMNESNLNGIGGIDVVAVDCSGNSFSTCTDVNGNYLFTGLTADTTYRIEFELPDPATCWSNPSVAGADNSTVIQFKKPGECAHLGLTGEIERPKFLVTNCYVQGAVDSLSAFAVEDAFIRWSYDNAGITTMDKTMIATKSQLGSTWGIAYDSINSLIYTTPFLKRHVGIPDHDGDGNADLDVIYSIDPMSTGTSSTSVWLDLGALGVDAGTVPNDQTRGLGNEIEEYNDATTYSQVGKVGWGDLDISEDYSTLYAVNLFDKKLYSIDIATKTINGSYAVPNDCGTDGENRPFGLKYKNGKLYIGVTCDASISQLVTDLEANIYEFDGTNFTSVLNIPLDYDKGSTGISIAATTTWHPWDTTATTLPGFIANINTNVGNLYTYEQPMLSDIEFDDVGDMTISFVDLYAHRQGWANYEITGSTKAAILSGGDILKACFSGGVYTLESNASCGGVTTSGFLPHPHTGPNTNHGPGGGEFYFGDGYLQSAFDRYGHSETVVGGMALAEGTGELAINLFDPVDDGPLNNNGVAFLDWSTGDKNRGFRLATGESKGAALGDLEIVLGISPIEIGHTVWHDANENGFQDACEVGLTGVNVSLYKDDGTGNCCSPSEFLGTTITDANGNYIFNDSIIAVLLGAPTDTSVLKSNTNYYVVFGEAGQYAGSRLILGTDVYELTIQDAVDATHFNSDLIDSDAAEGSFNNLPFVSVTTGEFGTMDYSIAMGLIESTIPLPGVVGNRVWLDEDGDGIQDSGEPGIAGVVLELQNGICSSGVDCPTTITDANGGYIFRNVTPGDYTVKVLSGTTALDNIYDENDGTTVPNMEAPVTVTEGGEYVTADFGYNYVPKAATDAPAVITETGALGDRVWNDANSNGVEDAGEAGIENITINLYSDHDDDGFFDNLVMSTTTDANGRYFFDGLIPDAYVVEIVEAGITGAGFDVTPTADPDSDANNLTNPIVIAPGDVWMGGDFGYNNSSNPADIGSTVFIDVDGDGSYNAANDLPLGGVTVALVKDTDGGDDWDIGEELVATTITAADGSYLFPDLPAGDYVVVVTDVDNIINTMTNSVDPQGGNDGVSGVTLGASDDLTQNFGYVPMGHDATKGFIGDLIYLDQDANGGYSSTEPGIEGIEVRLLDGTNDAVLATTFTDENGLYYFGALDAGDYKVKVETSSLPAGLTNSVDPDGSAPGDNITNSFPLAAGASDLDKDFGYAATTPRMISGTIWDDENAEGTLEGTESDRFANVTIDLLDADSNIIAQTTTDATGAYLFTGIPAGVYTVEVIDDTNVLEGYWHSPIANDNENDPVMIDVTTANVMDVDFGYYKKAAALGNFVWLDYNNDGIQDGNEPGLEGAKITLEIDYDGGGVDITVVQLAGLNGSYSFDHLLLDEDYQGDGVGTEPTFTLKVDPPNNHSFFSSTANLDAGGDDNLDADDDTGVTASPQQGKVDVALTNVTEPQSSFDFAFDFDCSQPSVEYAVTLDGSDTNAAQTTDYFLTVLNGDTCHIAETQKYGIIRSYTYCPHGEWNYYFNPLDPEEYLFAVRHNAGGGGTTNTTEIEYIELRMEQTPSDRFSIGANDATFVMMRDWFVKTKNGAALTAPVDIRFYFPENEFENMYSEAINQATNDWGVGTPQLGDIKWFKKDVFDPMNDINDNASILIPFDITN